MTSLFTEFVCLFEHLKELTGFLHFFKKIKIKMKVRGHTPVVLSIIKHQAEHHDAVAYF